MKTAQALFLGLVATTLCVPVVYAQGAVLEEVVVTARKRAETLEESPVSVRAFTSDEIESAGIQKPGDFIGLTPNVTLVETQNAGTAFINVRGISQARNSEMSVAVLVDGVLMPNPNQFNQQLVDIQQIEVLRGPQGALYGRNAIGGAITIVTKQPGDEFEGKVELGADSGPGYTVRGTASGPIGDSDVWKYRVSGSWVDTDGFIDNPVLGEEVDYIEDLNARARIIYEPNDVFSADLRLSASQFDGGALYFVIDAEADDTEIPVQTNNLGNNERDIYSASLKLEWEWAAGSFTSITSYDDVEEIFAGDQFDFLPREQSFLNLDQSGFGDFIKFLTGDEVVDLSQTQYLESEAWSQEFRFISPAEERFRYIVGAYAIATDRYISTGNQVDRGNGVFPVRRTPRTSVFVPAGASDPSPQVGLLADEQDNFAWAVFGDISYDLTDTLEGSFSLRYDEDTRETTTLTEPLYDPTGGLATLGEVRKQTWDELQPKLTLRYRPTDALTVYGGYSRGFRSGGFNQSGVGGAVPEPGIEDVFEAQVADTYEAGIKGVSAGGRFAASLNVYYTDFENAYFFFFDPGTSTQNLGSIPEVEYTGFELEGNAMINDYLTGYFGVGYTDGEIQRAADPADNGNQAPLVTEWTFNLGGEFRYPVTTNADFVLRADYSYQGDTYWDPGNISVRSPINLLDMRVGVDVADNWSLMLWAKNLTDERYNTEFSPGPAPTANFLWPAQPRRWGASFVKQF